MVLIFKQLSICRSIFHEFFPEILLSGLVLLTECNGNGEVNGKITFCIYVFFQQSLTLLHYSQYTCSLNPQVTIRSAPSHQVIRYNISREVPSVFYYPSYNCQLGLIRVKLCLWRAHNRTLDVKSGFYQSILLSLFFKPLTV